MKIAGNHVYQVDLPLKEGRYSWADGKFVEVFDNTVVEIETDEGLKSKKWGHANNALNQKFQKKTDNTIKSDSIETNLIPLVVF